MNKSLLLELTWEEYHARISDAVLIIPVGSTEQHTKHLPLGVDSVIAKNFALAIASHTDALVAPTLTYGCKSQATTGGGGSLFPGNIELDGDTFINFALNIIKEFIADGWQRILVMNGHYENQPFLVEAADLVASGQESPYPKILVTNWWENLSAELLLKIFDEVEFPGWELEHAGIAETSLMMHFAPHLVHEGRILDEGLDKVPSYSCFPPRRDFLPASGCIHTARSSSGKKGQLVVENVVKNILKVIEAEFKH